MEDVINDFHESSFSAVLGSNAGLKRLREVIAVEVQLELWRYNQSQ